jgi:Tol biopolymer transport system component
VTSEDVRVVDVDGTDDRGAATTAAFEESPAQSPDGTQVAWVERTEAGSEPRLVVADADGSSPRTVATGVGSTLTWSPDGDLLAFGVGNELHVVEPDGTGERTLVDLPAVGEAEEPSVGRPVWSPDGARIAFVEVGPFSFDGNGPFYVSIVDADGTDRRRVSTFDGGTAYAWSPDGRRLLFHDEGTYRILDVATGTSTPLLYQASLNGVDWSPDGRTVVIHNGRGNGFVTVDVEDVGTGCQVVTEDEPFFEVDTPRFTPDGDAIVFRGTTRTSSSSQTEALYRDDLTCEMANDTDGADHTQVVDVEGFGWFDVGVGAVTRLLGPTRVDTAVEISEAVHDAATTVVIARSDVYADGLAGAPLAAAAGGPLLLTPTDRLAPVVAAEIDRLGATAAILLGDAAALSARVASDLEARGVTVERVAGPTRFDTASEIAERVGGTSAYVVEGLSADRRRGWPDALAASGIAALQERPILLVTRDELPDATRDAIRSLGIDRVTVVGGTAAVSDAVVAELRAEGVTVERVAGTDRYATTALVADRAVAAGASPARVFAGTGADWPDALAGGAAAGVAGGVLLLTGTDAAPAWVRSHAAAIERIDVLGGPDVLTPATVVALERADQ